MRDSCIRFSVDVNVPDRLHALAEDKHLSVSALRRHLVYQAINRVNQKETGDHGTTHR